MTIKTISRTFKQAPLAWLFALLILVGFGVAVLRNPAPRLRRGVHLLPASDRTLALAEAAGFDTAVAIFSWRDIEPARGEYRWQTPDEVVNGAAFYNLDLVVRLDQPPAWASPAGAALDAPPADLGDYARFASAVAARYQGRMAGYIIWNEPNLAVNWGGQPPDPVGYAALLKAAFAAIKAADPDALVISAGLASTNQQDAAALDDRLFVQAMYAAGAAPYFDALGAHPYGFGRPPDDARGAHDGLNLARVLDLHDAMQAAGDGKKPVWVTEFGWTVQDAAGAGGQAVTLGQQAEYTAAAFGRASVDWPWLQLLAVWNLGGEGHPEAGGYSLLEANGEPRPVFTALQKANGLLPPRLPRSSGSLTPDYRQVLAADAVIQLGGDLSTPNGARRAWLGTVYVPDVGARSWTLTMQIAQTGAWDQTVWVNGTRLAPASPPANSGGQWATAAWTAPGSLLRLGPNEIRVSLDENHPTSALQIKDIVLTR